MSLQVTAAFPPIQLTSNSVADVTGWIRDKNIVVIQTADAERIFHTLSFEELANVGALEDIVKSLENIRVIYVDCRSSEDLLEGGWAKLIVRKVKDVCELGINDVVGKIILEQRLVPNKVYI